MKIKGGFIMIKNFSQRVKNINSLGENGNEILCVLIEENIADYIINN